MGKPLHYDVCGPSYDMCRREGNLGRWTAGPLARGGTEPRILASSPAVQNFGRSDSPLSLPPLLRLQHDLLEHANVGGFDEVTIEAGLFRALLVFGLSPAGQSDDDHGVAVRPLA